MTFVKRVLWQLGLLPLSAGHICTAFMQNVSLIQVVFFSVISDLELSPEEAVNEDLEIPSWLVNTTSKNMNVLRQVGGNDENT